MKRFKVEGWYRYNDEKDFESLVVRIDTQERAITFFKAVYNDLEFYTITVEDWDFKTI